MQQHQLQARDLMDRRLEHLLLPVGLPEKRSSKRAGLWAVFKRAAVGLPA